MSRQPSFRERLLSSRSFILFVSVLPGAVILKAGSFFGIGAFRTIGCIALLGGIAAAFLFSRKTKETSRQPVKGAWPARLLPFFAVFSSLSAKPEEPEERPEAETVDVIGLLTEMQASTGDDSAVLEAVKREFLIASDGDLVSAVINAHKRLCFREHYGADETASHAKTGSSTAGSTSVTHDTENG